VYGAFYSVACEAIRAGIWCKERLSLLFILPTSRIESIADRACQPDAISGDAITGALRAKSLTGDSIRVESEHTLKDALSQYGNLSGSRLQAQTEALKIPWGLGGPLVS